MNKFNTIVFAALTVLGSAQAIAAGQTHNISFNNPGLSADSKLSRAEVQADYQRAVASGQLHDLSINRFTSPAEHRDEAKLTRAEVVRARGAGELNQVNVDYAPYKAGAM
jgi:hypothetical protein